MWDVSAALNTSVASGQCLHVLKEHSNLASVAFSPDGKILASGGSDATIWLWQLATPAAEQLDIPPRRLNPRRGHSSNIRRLAFCPATNGAPFLLASVSEDQTVRLWDVQREQCRHVLRGHSQYVLSVAFSPDGTVLASSSFDQTIRLWDVESGQCLRILRPPGPYAGLQIRGVTAISAARWAALMTLGAVEA